LVAFCIVNQSVNIKPHSNVEKNGA
jgi:hypothetical protein